MVCSSCGKVAVRDFTTTYKSNDFDMVKVLPKSYLFKKLNLNKSALASVFERMIDSVYLYQNLNVYDTEFFHYIMFREVGDEIISYSQDWSLDLIADLESNNRNDFIVYGVLEYRKYLNTYFIVCFQNKKREELLIKQIFDIKDNIRFNRHLIKIPNDVFPAYYDRPYGFIVKTSVTDEEYKISDNYIWGIPQKYKILENKK